MSKCCFPALLRIEEETLTVAAPTPHVARALRQALAVPLLVIGALCAGLAWQVAALSEHNRWVSHTDEVIAETWRVNKLIVDHETSLRARLMTGDPTYLEPYTAARAELPGAVGQLRELVADNPPQQARIDDLRSRYQDWLHLAETDLAGAQAGQAIVGPTVVEGMRARRTPMDEMRLLTQQILAEENRLLMVRQDITRKSTRRALLWGGLGALVLGIIGAVAMHRIVMSLDAAYAEAFRAQAEALRTSEALAAEMTEQLRLAEGAIVEAQRGQLR